MLDIFATNAPGPSHWTLNSCFGEFHSVWVHWGSFRYCTKLHAIWVELVVTEKSTCHEVVSDIFATNAPSPPHWTLKSCFCEFYSVWLHLGSFRYCTKLVAIWAKSCAINEKSSWHKVVSNIFTTNALDPLHWTLNSCFGEFRSVWVHLGSFPYCTKLDAIWVELVPLLKKVRATRSCRTF